MLTWLRAAEWLHMIVAILVAIGFFRFLLRTRFWFPRYLHWLAAIALLVGWGLLVLAPRDAPVNQGSWSGVERALVVLLFPAIVYIFFVFHGGQHAAYEARRRRGTVRCPNCGNGGGLPGDTCKACGQRLPGLHRQRP
jgi:hypothetical protein